MPKRPDPVRFPAFAAVEYERELRRELLDPTIKRLRANLRSLTRQGLLTADEMRRHIAEAIASMERVVTQVAQEAAEGHVVRTARWHRRRYLATMHQAGLDVSIPIGAAESVVRQLLADRIADNVALVRTIPRRMHTNLTRRLQQVADSRKRFDPGTMRRILHQEYGSTGWNLRRLARDQTTKQIGQLTQVRHMQSGFRRYTWISAGDSRVRDTHAANDGQVFEWTKPPTEGHPGHEILCRCQAVPYVEDRDIQAALGQPVPDNDIIAFSRGHGIVRPKAGTKTARVWDIADRMQGRTRKEVLDAAVAEGINPSTAATQLGRRKRATGSRTRAPRPRLSRLRGALEKGNDTPSEFRSVPVFPNVEDDLAKAWDDLYRIVTPAGRQSMDNLALQVVDDLDGAAGIARMRSRLIVLRSHHDTNQMRSILWHEIAHFLEEDIKGPPFRESLAMLKRLEGRRQDFRWLHNVTDYAFTKYWRFDTDLGRSVSKGTELVSCAVQRYMTRGRAWMLKQDGGQEIVDWLERHVFKKKGSR